MAFVVSKEGGRGKGEYLEKVGGQEENERRLGAEAERRCEPP